MQIGSKNNPQTAPWNLSTTLPEGTTVLGFSIGLCVASGGNSTCSVTMSENYSFSQNFNNTGDIDYYVRHE
ncbi:MAG: hypothetical protein LBC89_02980 [Bacteroidales bacterium]|nr:hypothetical protein [Bacteroidales bacterium]